MSHNPSPPRLLLFLADVEGNLTALRQTLRRICAEVDLPLDKDGPEVKWAEGPEALAEAGWHVAEVALPTEDGAAAAAAYGLETHLEGVVKTLARDFRDRAIGVFADRHHSYARASVCGPGRPARLVEGEYQDVVRQLAKWLDVEVVAVARLLAGPELLATTKNVLAAAVDWGDGPEAAPGQGPATKDLGGPDTPLAPPEPDEDDRYVEAKLAQGRAFMQEYLKRQGA